MMVSAGGQKQRAGKAPDDFVEAKRDMIEGLGTLEIADLQMHVAHFRPSRQSSPLVVAGSRRQSLDVQSVCRHENFLPAHPPLLTRTIGVDLNPQTIGIPEIQRFADRV